jgi:integrase
MNIPEDLNAEWLEFSKGYKNRVAENIASGTQETAGSDKLTFEQYRILSNLAIKSDTFYAHGFLLLAWNLMTRAGSTGNIKFEHLRWDGDDMTVVIPKHKRDRSGGKLPTEKSVYANPIYPEICPFLTLGIILFSRENNGNIEAMFKGKKLEENINNWLKKTLDPTNNEVITRSHLTSHCTRKGKLSMNCI